MQGCVDGNGDGYSDAYGPVRSQLALMGSNPTSSIITFIWPLFVFCLTLFTVRMSRKEPMIEDYADSLIEDGGEF